MKKQKKDNNYCYFRLNSLQFKKLKALTSQYFQPVNAYLL